MVELLGGWSMVTWVVLSVTYDKVGSRGCGKWSVDASGLERRVWSRRHGWSWVCCGWSAVLSRRVVVVGVFLVVEFPLAVLFVIVIVQNSLHVEIVDTWRVCISACRCLCVCSKGNDDRLHVEIIGAEMGDTASVFINLLILLSYSANFFIYCAMSAQFRAALFDTFSRRRANDLNTTTAALDAVSRAAGRRSTAATTGNLL